MRFEAEKAEVLAEASKLLGIELTEEKLARLKETLGLFTKLDESKIAKIKQVLDE